MTNTCSPFKFDWTFVLLFWFGDFFFFYVLQELLTGFANITLQQIVAAWEEDEIDSKQEAN